MTSPQRDTYKMLRPFVKGIEAPMFLSGFFQADGVDAFHNQKKIQIDKEQEAERVAIPVDSVTSNYNFNNSNDRDEMEVTPPVYKEGEKVSTEDLYDRATGVDPYKNNDFQRNGSRLAFKAAVRLRRKVRRALELQASQILTTGELDLIDDSGATKYALDYNMSSSLFPTASVAWSTAATAVPLDDIGGLCQVIRLGGNDAKIAIMSAESFEAAMAVTAFEKRFTAVNANVGALQDMRNPGTRNGNFRGRLQVYDWTLDIYTYGAVYDAITTGTAGTKYVTAKKCIIMSGGRLDATFGGIPRFGSDQQALRYLPGRISSQNGRMDMTFNAWFDNPREVLSIGVGTRALLIPTDKTAFGCLDTDLA